MERDAAREISHARRTDREVRPWAKTGSAQSTLSRLGEFFNAPRQGCKTGRSHLAGQVVGDAGKRCFAGGQHAFGTRTASPRWSTGQETGKCGKSSDPTTHIVFIHRVALKSKTVVNAKARWSPGLHAER